ncbi:MAG TPA: TlpA disulfide reductase family protein [Thermoanaerobaculia bacterium]|nr:TlpA disulfide reductase family protein [Thermoanaerobaculia bacterium]
MRPRARRSLFTCLLLAFAAPLCADGPVGTMAPDFTLGALAGPQVRLSDFRGKVVLLDFWATWCGPCVAALPSLKTLAQDFAGEPFAVISVSGDVDGAKLRDFVGSHAMDWTQVWDDESRVRRLYGIFNLPTYLLLDPDGRVLWQHTGYSPDADQALRHEIARALTAAKRDKKSVASRA